MAALCNYVIGLRFTFSLNSGCTAIGTLPNPLVAPSVFAVVCGIQSVGTGASFTSYTLHSVSLSAVVVLVRLSVVDGLGVCQENADNKKPPRKVACVLVVAYRLIPHSTSLALQASL